MNAHVPLPQDLPRQFRPDISNAAERQQVIQNAEHLSPKVVALFHRLEAQTNDLISKAPLAKRAARQAKAVTVKGTSTRGRKPAVLGNPLYGHVTIHDRGVPWLDDIVTGAARAAYSGDKSASPASLFRILVSCEVISARTISEEIGVAERQAQRYLLSLTMAMPYLVKSCPWPTERKPAQATPDFDDMPVPDPVELAALRHAIGEDAFLPRPRTT